MLWLRSKPSELNPVFVLGAPRSGSSLLKNLLVSHSALCGTDRESTGFFRLRNFSNFKLGEIDPAEYQAVLAGSNGLPELYEGVVRKFISAKDARIFVDKVSIAAWRLRYIRKYFPNAKFVNIFRDGRDSYCSAINHPNVNQSSSASEYARYWSSCVSLPNRILAEKQMISIKYEDLVQAPEAQIKRVMQFLNLEFEAKQIDPLVFTQVSSLGRRARYHSNLVKPITTDSVGKWKNELSIKQIQMFEQVAGRRLTENGYEIAGWVDHASKTL